MRRPVPAFAIALVAVASLAACDRPPQPPDKSDPPEPQVSAPALRAPLDRAAAAHDARDTAAHTLGAAAASAGG